MLGWLICYRYIFIWNGFYDLWQQLPFVIVNSVMNMLSKLNELLLLSYINNKKMRLIWQWYCSLIEQMIIISIFFGNNIDNKTSKTTLLFTKGTFL